MLNEVESSILDLQEKAREKINNGEELLQALDLYNIEGIQKLHRKIKQEIDFLKKISKTTTIKKEHLQCSNLTHFSALVKYLSKVENCVSVSKVFNLGERKIVVDVVCNGGLTWIKVIARNPKSISQICLGNTNYGVRSILDQAIEFLECVQSYPCLFQTPLIKFVFANGVGSKLATKLESLGIIVEGDKLNGIDEDYDFDIYYDSDLSTKNTSHIKKVNLDVSAMLAYVSSVTNGSCDKYEFTVPVLTQQAAWECKRPVKPILDAYFKDKTLYCCQTARNNFINILKTVGGPNEQIRGERLLERLTVLPDDATVKDTVEFEGDSDVFNNVQFTPNKTLEVGGKIRERSLIIFKFGDRIQAVTVTANDGFVRAARQQGINFVVFVHESRALTEQKEQKAKRIVDS